MDAAGKTQGAIAGEAKYHKATVSRVTDPQLSASVDVVKAYVEACGRPSEQWVQLHLLAKTAVERPEEAERFARALKECCAAHLPEEYGQQLGTAQDLTASWAGRTAEDGGESTTTPTSPEEEPPPGHRQAAAAAVPQTARIHGGRAADATGPGPGEAGPHERGETGAEPSAEERGTGPSGTPEAGTPRKRPRRARPRTVLTCGTALLLLTGAGIWITQNHTTADETHPPVVPSPSSTAQDDSLQRLQEARAGKGWVIGVKDGQPGLSEKDEKGKWKGVEIDYARAIVEALGIKNYTFRVVGTGRRPDSLDDGTVDMFVGTYGMSPDREKGKNGDPPVLFAGPYFQTQQGIMLQRYSKDGEPDQAKIYGQPVTVRSTTELKDVKARLCVAENSTADLWLTKNKKEWPKATIARQTDYDTCVRELQRDYDAVLTDEVILQGFQNRYPSGTYMLARDGFGETEKYGIGLKQDSLDLKREVCKAMQKTEKKRNELYGKLKGKLPDLPEC